METLKEIFDMKLWVDLLVPCSRTENQIKWNEIVSIWSLERWIWTVPGLELPKVKERKALYDIIIRTKCSLTGIFHKGFPTAVSVSA